MRTHQHKHVTPAAQAPPTAPTITTQTAVASGDKGRKAPLISAEAVRLSAYRKWESAGKPAGDGVQFWLEAEQEFVQGK